MAGKIKHKLLRLLNEAGLDIPDVDCFWVQMGGYRHRFWDLARWGADWGVNGSCYSYSTMTECVKYGLEVSRDGASFSVSSKMTTEQREEEIEKSRAKDEAIRQDAEDRRRRRREERRKNFQIYRCNACGLQFPWHKGEDLTCMGCRSEDIRNVTEEVL